MVLTDPVELRQPIPNIWNLTGDPWAADPTPWQTDLYDLRWCSGDWDDTWFNVKRPCFRMETLLGPE